MSRLWSLFRPAPPAPLEQRVVPSAPAPVVDAGAIDALFAGLPASPTPEILGESASPPPPPPEFGGEVRGTVTTTTRDGIHQVELRGEGAFVVGEAMACLEGSLRYDDPTQPPDSPRAAGSLQIRWPSGSLRLALESREERGKPSLLFPREFRFLAVVEPPDPTAEPVAGVAWLTLHTHRRRGSQPAHQSFTFGFAPRESV